MKTYHQGDIYLEQCAFDSESNFETISEVLENYYAEKNVYSRIRQKSVDLRKIVATALERNVKTYDLQIKQQKDAEKKEKYKHSL